MGYLEKGGIYGVLNAPLSLKRNARSQINNKPKKSPLRADSKRRRGQSREIYWHLGVGLGCGHPQQGGWSTLPDLVALNGAGKRWVGLLVVQIWVDCEEKMEGTVKHISSVTYIIEQGAV